MALEYTEEKLNSLDKETVIRLFLAQQTQLKLIDRISVIGSRIAISDAGVGITMCEAAMKGASLNVFINTKLMKDRELAEDMNFKADKMLAEAAQIEEETFGRVMDAVRP